MLWDQRRAFSQSDRRLEELVLYFFTDRAELEIDTERVCIFELFTEWLSLSLGERLDELECLLQVSQKRRI